MVPWMYMSIEFASHLRRRWSHPERSHRCPSISRNYGRPHGRSLKSIIADHPMSIRCHSICDVMKTILSRYPYSTKLKGSLGKNHCIWNLHNPLIQKSRKHNAHKSLSLMNQFKLKVHYIVSLVRIFGCRAILTITLPKDSQIRLTFNSYIFEWHILEFRGHIKLLQQQELCDVHSFHLVGILPIVLLVYIHAMSHVLTQPVHLVLFQFEHLEYMGDFKLRPPAFVADIFLFYSSYALSSLPLQMRVETFFWDIILHSITI